MTDRKQTSREHTTGTSNRTAGDPDAHRDLNAEASPRDESSAARRDRGEDTAHGETERTEVPPRAEKGKMPRFGSAGSGGLEFEPGPEKN